MTEITDEQRAAWQRLDEIGAEDASPETERLLLILAPLLPSELTNPQPAPPTEPGWYLDEAGDAVYQLRADGWYDGQVAIEASEVSGLTLRPLVFERPQVTPEEIDEAWLETRDDASIPRYVDGSMSAYDAFRAGFCAALVNGADQ